MDANQKAPYVGPRTFETSERDLFFGRTREARDLLSLVISERLSLFYAQSGAGKSSLINTSLIPDLQAEGFEVLPVGRVSGEAPPWIEVDNIYIYNLLLSLDQSNQLAENPFTRTYGEFAQLSLPDFLDNLVYTGDESGKFYYNPNYDYPEDYELKPRVLIIDQFEEIMTTHPEAWSKRADFFKQIRRAMKADAQLWVVLSMREDYVAALRPYAYLVSGSLQARYYMQRMKSKAALQAITQPVAQRRPFAKGVAEKLVEDLRQIRTKQPDGSQTYITGQFVEPVQLQVVCLQLWRNLKEENHKKEITKEDLNALAGSEDWGQFIDKALAQFYEQAIAEVATDLPGQTEFDLRNWFGTRLITKTRNRNLLRKTEEGTGGLDNKIVKELQDRFLLRSEDRAGSRWYELVHDRFIEPILQSNQEWEKDHPLIRTARDWQNTGEPESRLYHGRRLAEALEDPDARIPLVQEFLKAGQRLEQERQRELERAQEMAELERQRAEEQAQAARRFRYLAIGMGVALIVVVIAVLIAINALDEADKQKQIALDNEKIAVTQAAVANTARATAEAERLLALAAQSDAMRSAAIARDQKDKADEAKDKAAESARQADQAFLEQLAAQAQTLSEVYPQRSLLLARQILKENDLPAAEQALRQALAQIGGYGLGGHKYPLDLVTFSPDNRWLVTASREDETFHLWQLQPNEPPAHPIKLEEHKYGVKDVKFSPDGRWMLTTGNEGGLFKPDNTIRLWDLSLKNPGSTDIALTGHTNPIALTAISPDSHWLATASVNDRDPIIRLWDLTAADPSANPIELIAHTKTIAYLKMSADNRWLVTADTNKDNSLVYLWDLNAADPAASPIQLTGHQDGISALALSPDSRWLFTAGNATTAYLWDLTTEAPSAAPLELTDLPAPITHASFSPDNRRLVTHGGSITTLWSMTADDDITMLTRLSPDDYYSTIEFSPDGKWLAVGRDLILADKPELSSNKGLAYLWNLTAVEKAALDTQEETFYPGSETGESLAAERINLAADSQFGIRHVVFSADSRWLVTTGGQGDTYRSDNTARLWNLTAKNPAADPIELRGHTEPIGHFAISPNNNWLVTSGGLDAYTKNPDTTIRLWRLGIGGDPSTDPITLKGHEDAIFDATFSPEGDWLVTRSQDGTARLWNLDAPYRVAAPFILNNSKIENNDGTNLLSPNNHWLTTSSDTEMLWNLNSSNPLENSMELSAHVTSFSPNNRWLVTSDGQLWDLNQSTSTAQGSQLNGLQNGINLIQFSSDNRWLFATGFDEDAVHLWDLTAANPTADPILLTDHEEGINLAQFSSNNHWLLTTGFGDDPARLWDLTTVADAAPKPILLNDHPNEIKEIDFSENGRWLITTGNNDSVPRLWDLTGIDSPAANRPTLTPIVLSDHTKIIEHVIISPDSHWALTVAGQEPLGNKGDALARLWNLNAADPAAEPIEITDHENGFNKFEFSPDGRWLITTGNGDNTAYLRNLSNPEAANTPVSISGHTLPRFTLSHNGRWLVTFSEFNSTNPDNTARLWNLTSNNPTADPFELQDHQKGVNSASFSANDEWLITTDGNDTAHLWHLMPPNSNHIKLSGHQNKIRVVSFSPDNRWLATGSQDATVRLWDLTRIQKTQATNPRPIILYGHRDWVDGLYFSPHNRYLVTYSSFEPSIRLWDLRQEALKELACQVAIRNLTLTEWQEHFTPEKNYEATCPSAPIHPSVTQPLLEEAKQADDMGTARAKFEAALARDPTLALDPTAEAKEAVAQNLIKQGIELINADNIMQARTKFEAALELDSALEFDPDVEIGRLAAQNLIEQARDLARTTLITDAITKIEEAAKFDSTIDVDSELATTKSLAAQSLLEQAKNLIFGNDIQAAAENLQQAVTFDPQIELNADFDIPETYNTLCSQGHSEGLTQIVLPWCQRAVELAVETEDFWLNIDLCENSEFEELIELVRPACARAVDLAEGEDFRINNDLCAKGKIEGLTDVFQPACARAVELALETEDAWLNNSICQNGQSEALTQTVLPACQRAVELAVETEDVDLNYAICRNSDTTGLVFTVLPACERALALVTEVNDPLVNYQICIRQSTLEALSHLSSPVCESFNVTGISSGDTINNQIEPGDSQFWIFSGQAGQLFTVTTEKDLPSELTTWLTLLEPNGDKLEFDDGSSDNGAAKLDEVELPVDGIYTIVVQGIGDSGDYELTLIEETADEDQTSQ